MSFNGETFALMIKFAGAMVGVLLLIWLIAVGTPYVARFIDKHFGKINIDQGASSVPDPARVEGENGGSAETGEYKVYDIYEGTPSENENNDKKD